MDSVEIPKLGFVDDLLDANRCGKETKEANRYTTDQINKRKLHFSTDKCVRMHVKSKGNNEKKEEECESLHIDEWRLETFEEEGKTKVKDVYKGKAEIKTEKEHVYLGNIIESNGSNRKNILSRVKKGQAAIKDINQILNGVFFGPFYFEVLMLLRETLFMSVITHNLEVSFNLTDADLKLLEDLDLQLLRGCLLLGRKSSRCLIFLELGLTNVSFIIKKKRVMYLFNLLTCDDTSLVSQVFREQAKKVERNSWTHRVIKDLEELEIGLSFEQISQMSKQQFKSIVNRACANVCLDFLLKQKANLSKGKELIYTRLETQSYFLSTNKLSIDEMRGIYQIRCRELPLKTNFPFMFGNDKKCLLPLCKEDDTQMHIFDSLCFSKNTEIVDINLRYSDIFENDVKSQLTIMRILFQKLEVRKQYTALYDKELPSDPRLHLGIKKAKQTLKSIKRKRSKSDKNIKVLSLPSKDKQDQRSQKLTPRNNQVEEIRD